MESSCTLICLRQKEEGPVQGEIKKKGWMALESDEFGCFPQDGEETCVENCRTLWKVGRTTEWRGSVWLT